MLKGLSSKILFMLMIFSLTTLVSCKKMLVDSFTKKKLLGTWEIVPLGPSTQTVTWTFYDNDSVIQQVDGVTVTDAIYTVNRNWVGYMIDFEGFQEVYGIADMDGNYDVLKNNKEIMILQRIKHDQSGTPFFRIEFQKK